MDDMMLRIRYIRQMMGYYFLLMLCQIGGEVIVALTVGGIPLNADSDAIAAGMVDVLSAHTYAILAVTYILLAAILLLKRIRAKSDLVIVDGFKARLSGRHLFWGLLMGAGGCIWSSVIVELLPRHISAFQRLTAGEAAENVEPMWLEFAAIVLLSSFFEELIFRGIIFSRARVLSKPTAAVIIQAMIFASMYSGTVNMVYAFVMGLVLGYACLMAGSVWAPIVVRMAFNAATMAANPFYDAIFSGRDVTVAVLAVSGAIFVVSCFAYYNNKNRLLTK